MSLEVKDMEIRFFTHLAAENFLSFNADIWDSIVIINSGSLVSQNISAYSRSTLTLLFDDIDCPFPPYVIPNKQDVEKALEFSIGKEKLLVTCVSGTTRCTAIGYVVKCKECPPKKAITLLKKRMHHPNRMVIRFGADILGNEEVFTVYDDYFPESH